MTATVHAPVNGLVTRLTVTARPGETCSGIVRRASSPNHHAEYPTETSGLPASNESFDGLPGCETPGMRATECCMHFVDTVPIKADTGGGPVRDRPTSLSGCIEGRRGRSRSDLEWDVPFDVATAGEPTSLWRPSSARGFPTRRSSRI